MNDYLPLFKELSNEAESLFGKGIETFAFRNFLNNNRGPQIEYFGNQYDIILSQSINNHRPNLIFELSHEVVHTLGLIGPDKETNFLEEGVAAYFSVHNSKCMLRESYKNQLINTDRYNTAYQEVESILTENPNFVKELRLLQPFLTKVNEVKLEEIDNEMSDTRISILLCSFPIKPRNVS